MNRPLAPDRTAPDRKVMIWAVPGRKLAADLFRDYVANLCVEHDELLGGQPAHVAGASDAREHADAAKQELNITTVVAVIGYNRYDLVPSRRIGSVLTG